MAAIDADRRATFVAALEQSEQFFSAAAASEPQTRGLLLFYGVSQAGRALRAAQQDDDDWGRAGNHGIKVIGESTSTTFADTLVRDSKNKPADAFGWAATTLSRASLPRETRVGDISRLLFPQTSFPLAGEDPSYPALELKAVRDRSSGLGQVSTDGLRADLRVPTATWVMSLPEVPGRATSDYDAYKAHVRAQLAQYPTLEGAVLYEATPGHFQPQPDGAGGRVVELVWPHLPGWDGVADAPLHGIGDENRSTVRVWPSLPGVAQGRTPLASHPFLLWWALLYAVSHFVRYEPKLWAQFVDVDGSEEAVALEALGDVALDALPELIHRTLVRREPQ